MRHTVRFMKLEQANGAVAASWILGAGLFGLLADVTSVGGAALVLGVGLVPPTLLMLRWTHAGLADPIPAELRTRS